ncbi:MAG TPA: YciI family protein [Diaminobutyricibacter sp.]
MKYLILINGNEKSRAVWESFTDEQRSAGYELYAALHQRLQASGELVAAEALTDPSLAVRVPARDSSLIATDGPFAEVKEQLNGFYLVDCESLDRAVEIAEGFPEAAYGLVEVRPVLTLGGPDV